VEDLKFGNMTTYIKTISQHPDRNRKKEVRDFLFSLFRDMHLRKIVGLAGPNIQDYIDFCKSQGFTEFEIYEKDGLTAIHQLTTVNDKIVLKLTDILNADANEPDVLFDLDYCVTGRYMEPHMAKFLNRFIMTFSIRGVSVKETMERFFRVRDEKVIGTAYPRYPFPATEYFTNKGKYLQLSYRDTAPMMCLAKIL
jgi:hypothetical protein